jgi:signal transduction histidine kinase
MDGRALPPPRKLSRFATTVGFHDSNAGLRARSAPATTGPGPPVRRLLGQGLVSITPPIRHRLLTVVFLGVITSGLSLLALVRLLSTNKDQRIERGRDSVTEVSARLAVAHPDKRQLLLEAPRSQTIGMRGGYSDPAGNIDVEVPPLWRAPVAAAVARAVTGGHGEGEAPLPDGTLVVNARRAADGTYAWAALAIRTPPYLDNWRWIVLALSLATLLLVAAAVHAVITVRRSASSLNGALVALAQDLSTPVPRPTVLELQGIAEGIAALARKLALSREAQERLGRELARQERLAALGRVVAGVAHEVRNPLASIKLRLDLAASASPVLPAPVQQAVTHASSEITRLDRLVADLLVVAGRALGPQRRVALGGLIRERAEALGPWAQLRRVAVSVTGEATAQVDPDSISRALDNVLRNAIEASPAGAAVDISVLDTGREVKIQVDDRGAGVEVARAAELFEPFFTTKADGTGLGLAISRALARAHGGDLVYQRTAEVTRFELTLPSPPATALRQAAS